MPAYWGDLVVSTVPDGGTVKVDESHEGVWLLTSKTITCLSPEEARRVAENLMRAADRWEED